MAKHRIYTTSFASVYPFYVAKAEKKGRTKTEVDQVISWLTGYGQNELEAQLEQGTDFETFFAKAPKINPSRTLITGVVCGVRVEDVKEPTMREIRYLDKLIDELAKGKAMDRILPKVLPEPLRPPARRRGRRYRATPAFRCAAIADKFRQKAMGRKRCALAGRPQIRQLGMSRPPCLPSVARISLMS
jgi:hypothetical protein